jgi:hypothetical protein
MALADERLVIGTVSPMAVLGRIAHVLSFNDSMFSVVTNNLLHVFKT